MFLVVSNNFILGGGNYVYRQFSNLFKIYSAIKSVYYFPLFLPLFLPSSLPSFVSLVDFYYRVNVLGRIHTCAK